MPTYTEMVESLILESRRPDMRLVIAADLNSTIRDLHFRTVGGDGGAPVRYSNNLVEDELTLAGSAPYMWDIPRPALFMAMEDVFCRNRNIHLELRSPKTIHRLSTDFTALAIYYRSGPAIVMGGVYSGDSIAISYYEYLGGLRLKTPDAQVIRSTETPGIYERISDSGVPTEAELAAETNWLLDKYDMVIREGVLSKLYRRINDLDRAKMSYSAFESGRISIQNTEATT